METSDQVIASRAGDHKAFTALVKSHQNLALGFAFSKLGDFQRAQDVVQESFIIAFQKLDQLEDPKVFASWLRGIIFHRCQRVFRMNPKRWVPLDRDLHLESGGESQGAIVQRRQEREFLQKAILELPEKHRTVVALFYLEENSQKAVADFLGIPLTKVNNYLDEARKKLKGRLLTMAEDTFRDQRLSEEFAKNIGEIIHINGALIDAKVNKSQRTTVFDVLGSKPNAEVPGPDLVVIQRLKNGRVRCISTGDSIAEKTKLYNSGNYEKALKELKEERIVESVEAMQSKGEKPVIESGIKVIDLLCPLRDGGSVGIFGREGVGRMVQVLELMHRRKKIEGNLSLFFYVDRWHALGTQDTLETDPDFASDINDNVQTAWIIHERAGDPKYAQSARYLDASLYFSPIKAIQGIWPAFDPLNSRSSALDPGMLSKDHYETARDVLKVMRTAHEQLIDPVHLEYVALGARQDALERKTKYVSDKLRELDPETRKIVQRGILLEHFFTQPFFVTEHFSSKKGVHVSLTDTISSCKMILAGEYDDRSIADVSWRGAL